jgi:hypothetical protein
MNYMIKETIIGDDISLNMYELIFLILTLPALLIAYFYFGYTVVIYSYTHIHHNVPRDWPQRIGDEMLCAVVFFRGKRIDESRASYQNLIQRDIVAKQLKDHTKLIIAQHKNQRANKWHTKHTENS